MIDEQRFQNSNQQLKIWLKLEQLKALIKKMQLQEQFEDANLKSYDLPIMVKQAKDDKDYWVPDIDEPVICIFLPIGIESGFILGAYYNQKDKPH